MNHSNTWFKRLEKHEKESLKTLIPLHIELRNTEKKVCETCPYREASHQFGCIECCPLIKAKEESTKQIEHAKREENKQ